MKALIVYDTHYGNTEQVAFQIASALEGRAEVSMVRAADVSIEEMAHADLLFVGGPTQWRGLSPTLKTLFHKAESTTLYGRAAAVFDTRYNAPGWVSGTAAPHIARSLKKLGACLLAEPESFFVCAGEGPLEKGETTRASRWAEGILQMAETFRPAVNRV
jgi:flavodoxin